MLAATRFLCSALLLGSTGLRAQRVEPPPPPRPNIVVILSDDMGFSDLGCYGGEIETPNLDDLAARGLRFAQFYNTGRCCPTRASLLTGLHPHQAGVGHMMEDRGVDGYRGRLGRDCVTIAQVLSATGYRCYAAGKWHVTPGATEQALTNSVEWPRQRGFERYYGTIHGAGSYFDSSSLVRDDTLVTAASDAEYRPEAYYYTDAVADHAVRFVREHARDHAAQPFFLYVAFTAAHWPLHAKPSDRAKTPAATTAATSRCARRGDRSWHGSACSTNAGPRCRRPSAGKTRAIRCSSAAAWRCTRRRSIAWIRASAASSPS